MHNHHTGKDPVLLKRETKAYQRRSSETRVLTQKPAVWQSAVQTAGGTMAADGVSCARGTLWDPSLPHTTHS